eukprot:2210416-Pleurochrysis_carterae.AAC.4
MLRIRTVSISDQCILRKRDASMRKAQQYKLFAMWMGSAFTGVMRASQRRTPIGELVSCGALQKVSGTRAGGAPDAT